VHSLEVDATIHPGRFRSKVVLIGSAPYLLLAGTLLGVFALIGLGWQYAHASKLNSSLLPMLLLALVMAPLLLLVLRLFLLRLPTPEGRYLAQIDAPKLFGVIDKMRKQLGGPAIHYVLLDERFNAGIVQRPRFGLLGGYANYLVLGLPYMLSMSPKETLSAIAHEYGHVCGRNGQLGAWIYRQRQTFNALCKQIDDKRDDNLVDSIVAKCLDLYMPYYNVYTFVMARQSEYDADCTAADIVGAKATAAGLIRADLLEHWMDEEFWPTLMHQASSRDKPMFLPFSALRTAFKASYEQWANKETLARAWREKSGLDNTHPALRERVEATGEYAKLPDCIDVSAADALLGGRTKMLVEEFDQLWWAHEKKQWRARFEHASRSTARLKELRGVALEKLNIQDLQELAILCAEHDKPDKTVLLHLLAQPGGPFARAEYEYGCLLLAGRDDKGLVHLANAARADRRWIEKSARVGCAFLVRYKDEFQAQQWWNGVFPKEVKEEEEDKDKAQA
jgi:Zn-dependent protease with chaperone function